MIADEEGVEAARPAAAARSIIQRAPSRLRSATVGCS